MNRWLDFDDTLTPIPGTKNYVFAGAGLFVMPAERSRASTKLAKTIAPRNTADKQRR
jgi:hypothetical protein